LQPYYEENESYEGYTDQSQGQGEWQTYSGHGYADQNSQTWTAPDLTRSNTEQVTRKTGTWKRIQSLEGDSAYWYNSETGETRWDEPSALQSAAAKVRNLKRAQSSFHVGNGAQGKYAIVSPKGKMLFDFGNNNTVS